MILLRMAWQSALLLALAAAGAYATWKWHPDAPPLSIVAETAPPGEISITDALELVKAQRILWLDARSSEQFAKGHIPGALPLNEQQWEEQVAPLFDALQNDGGKSTVVIYCDAARCEASKRIRDKMLTLPLGDFTILVLHGGYPAWQAAQGQ
jgi:rhodanese-related sulfurtransferase